MNRSFLSEIVGRKREVLAQLDACERTTLRDEARRIRARAQPHRLRSALTSDPARPQIIAEFKRRSPALGEIRPGADPLAIAALYERGGAAAISVLTDTDYFGGTLDDLIVIRAATELPLLRKDFIIDAVQIDEAAAAGADAVLLIVAALDHDSLGQLRARAEEELQIDALVEVHSAEELLRAADCGAMLVGVNNRDLRTFTVSIETSERLIADAPRHAVMVSESGLRSRAEIDRLARCGYRGFLIGETLMRASDPEALLRQLTAPALLRI
ncbi:MAG: indole-3-glycerol phosphate synthase TrpC [Chthoniobacterales bacterium]